MNDRANPKDSSELASLDRLETPFLALDPVRMQRNIVRLRERTGRLGVALRPHLKTVKSADVARRLFDGGVGPATVSTLREAEYFAAMQDMRRSRRRSGATRWDLYRIGEQPDHFLETFEVPSWEEHQRQHSGRLTAQDKEIEDRAHAFSVERSVARHLLPPGF